MSSQPNEKAPEVPEALVKDLLRSQGLPYDAHVKVNVHTTRVRLNPDGTRTIISESGTSGGQRTRARRLPSRRAAIFFSIVGFAQLAYGMWASHSDALAAPLVRGSQSCQLSQLMPRQAGADAPVTLQSSTGQPSVLVPCRIEKAVVFRRYTTTSRHATYYHISTVTPTGQRDDIPVVGRAGIDVWGRVQPTERITLQRFVLPGYHRTGDVIAVGDSVGAALSRWHPDSPNQNNLVNMLMGGLLFVTGMVMFVKSRAAD